MAQPTNTFATNDMIGIREDLSDTIANISPIETPFFSSVKKGKAENRLFEWQTDSLNATSTTPAIEGDDAPQNAGTATTRLNNRTHIKTRDARVTGSAQAVNTAGRANELDYQLLKRGRELKRDIETVLLDSNAKVTGTDTAGSETAGVVAWLATNTDGVSTDPTGDGTDTRADGTQRAFTEDQVKTVLGAIFTAGGNPTVLSLGAFNRQIFSTFANGRTNMQKVEDSTLHASFDVYASDFGSLKVVPNRFQRARDALILDMDMWQVNFLPGRNMVTFPIAKTGDSDAKQILSEFGLQATQEAASGGVFDLTTS